MDTAAYLTRQGWLGSGHSLHPTGRGIKKPLLISQKRNVLGIGQKRHDAHADQWWARAFDSSLKNLDVGADGTNDIGDSLRPGVSGILEMIHAGGQKWASNGGLYAGFVRGEGLRGTIQPEASTADSLMNDARGKLDQDEMVSPVCQRRRTDIRNQEFKEGLRQRQNEGQAGPHEALPRVKRYEGAATSTAHVRRDSCSHIEGGLKQSHMEISTENELTTAGEQSAMPKRIQMSKQRRKKKQKTYLA